MQLNLNPITGTIPATYPAVWYRVSAYGSDRFIADFDNQAEANRFAITDAKTCRYDHKVSTMKLSRA